MASSPPPASANPPAGSETNATATNPFESSSDSAAISTHADTDAAASDAPSAKPGDARPLEPASTPPVQPENAQTLHEEPAEDATGNPQVASLKAIFPDFDEGVLMYVLESVHWDEARAVDQLLAMSDPTHVAQAPPPRELTQTELDEEYARRIMREEEDEQRARWSAQMPPHRNSPRDEYDSNYAPGGGRGQQQRRTSYTGAVSDRDTMTEITEQFSKLAETGKKTFGSLLGKAKAKMAEFDQQRNTGSASGTEPRWGQGGPGASTLNSYQQEPLAPQHQQSPPPQSQRLQAAYYDPNATTHGSQTSPPSHVQGYDAAPGPVAPASSSPPAHEQPKPDSTKPEGESGVPPPPATGTGTGNVDYSRAGLLPKRPVSLLRDNPPQRKDTEDDDELEYTENPFEEGRK